MQTQQPELLGITLAHRAMLTDVRRLVAAVTEIGDGRARCSARRADAIARYTELMCESIHHHHTMEDDVLWPVIEASAGSIVDLTELTEDHAALDPRLEIIAHRATAFRVAGGERRIAALLAAELSDLYNLLSEHIAEEERDIFPVIQQHVSVDDWQAVEKTAQRTGRLTFDGPRTVGASTEEERAILAKDVSPILRLLLTVLAWRHRRFEDVVFSR